MNQIPLLTFVNMTDDPDEGREARRVFVRRSVMLDYHHRRRKPIRPEANVGAAPVAVACERHDASAATSTTDEDSFQEQTNSQALPKFDDRKIPQSLESYTAKLFTARFWPDSQHSRLSKLVQSFMVGQVFRAARDVSGVNFIHNTFSRHISLEDPTNPLSRCIYILRAACEASVSSQETLLWPKVHDELERMHNEVCVSLFMCPPVHAPQLLIFNEWFRYPIAASGNCCQ
jgi:hypothetical protein